MPYTGYNEKTKKWQQENTVVITMRLQKSTDADILDFLSVRNKQATIKAALREYMTNHLNE